MLSEAEITPTLDEPILPEFRGATLSLNNASSMVSNKKIAIENFKFSNDEANTMKEKKKIADLHPSDPSSNCGTLHYFHNFRD
jgi:hypothetical protein